jgi:hypothetical protein
MYFANRNLPARQRPNIAPNIRKTTFMDDDSFSKTIEYWQSVHDGNPQGLIDFLIAFSKNLSNNNNEYAEEVAALEKKINLLNRNNGDLFLVINDLRNALNQLHDAHAVSWLGQACHCDAHQKAYGVLMDVALWDSRNRRS